MTKVRQKIGIGDIVEIVFWDHAENFHDGMQFVCYGKITGSTHKAWIIHSWQYHDPLQRAADSNFKDNENCFAIVKSTIDSIRKLK